MSVRLVEDTDDAALRKFMRFLLTRTVVEVNERDLAEWEKLRTRVQVILDMPGNYCTAIADDPSGGGGMRAN